jgi:hypothetical protein
MRLLAVVTICLFIFSATAFGQVTACDPLDNCKCDPTEHNCGNVTVFNTSSNPGCANCDTIVGGGKTGTTHTCALATVPCDRGTNLAGKTLFPFDYDGEPYDLNMKIQFLNNPNRTTASLQDFGSYGYCETPENFNDLINPYNAAETQGTVDRTCKFLFDLCWCPEACLINQGTYMGVQMIIDADGDWTTVDDGVYFADAPRLVTFDTQTDADPSGIPVNPEYENQPTVYFELGEDQGNLCAAPFMTRSRVFLNNSNDRVAYEIEGVPANTKWQIRNFGPVSFYRGYQDRITRIGQTDYFVTAPLNQGTPVATDTISIADANRVTVLQSGIPTPTGLDIDSEYMFNDDDVKGRSHCWIWVDIPPMHIDPARAKKGATVRVKVRFLFHKEKFICENCAPPAICECVLDVATICCGEETAPNQETKLLYPYFTEMDQSGGYWSGIAITNRGNVNGTANLTVYESDGDVGTLAIPVNAHSVFADILTNMYGNMTLTTTVNGLGNSRCYIDVNTDFLADGFAMFGEYDNGWSLGYIPRVNP